MKRLFVVVLIALAGFVAAFVVFGDAARRNCVLDAPANPRYDAVVEEVGDDTVVRVTRDGEPVRGAWVCVSVARTGVTGAGVGAEAREIAPGRYAVPLDLGTPGRWSGSVVVAEDGAQPDAGVPVTVEVPAG